MTRRITKTPPTPNPELDALIEKAREATRICAMCGCTENNPCTDPILGLCGWWMDMDICTHCVPTMMTEMVVPAVFECIGNHMLPALLRGRAISPLLRKHPGLSRDYISGLVDATITTLRASGKD